MSMKAHIPNLFTAGNLLCGSIAIIFMLQHGVVTWAVLLIGLAGIFDVFDGAVARALKVSSPIGRELDSLADVISFGLAPTVISYLMMEAWLPESLQWIKYLSLLNVLCAALRLAKFNISTDQSTDFSGMPSPANGILWASLAAASWQMSLGDQGVADGGPMHDVTGGPSLLYGHSVYVAQKFHLIPILVLFTSWLMVSRIRMFSFKFHKGGFSTNRIPFIYIGSVLLLPVLAWIFKWPILVCVPLGIFWYILLSMVYHFSLKKKTA